MSQGRELDMSQGRALAYSNHALRTLVLPQAGDVVKLLLIFTFLKIMSVRAAGFTDMLFSRSWPYVMKIID